MKDINWPLRKAYNTALETTGYPAYYQQAPDDENSEVFLVFSGINASQVDTKSSEDSDVFVEVRIHTRKDKYNSGDMLQAAVNAVYTAMAERFDLSADGLQNISQKRDRDTELDYGTLNNEVYIDRIITFKHKIFIQ